MQTIPLTQGFVELVDDKDYEAVSQHKWCADVKPRTVYAIRATRKTDGTKTTQYLHRFITDVTDPQIEVDHHDHNGLNCQHHNLRVCTHSQNQCNRRRTEGSSQFKGVTRAKLKGSGERGFT
jgi:hypothetical protein